MTGLDRLTAALSPPGGEAATGFSQRVAALERELASLKAENENRSKRLSLLVFSGSFDRLLAAFTIATGAAAMGIQVTMFFAFWGIGAVRARRRFRGKDLCERVMAAMLPACPRQANLSQWSLGGLGRLWFRFIMRRNNMMQLEEMIAGARELGVEFVCCDTTSALMGIGGDELFAGVEPGGVATFLDRAYAGRVSLLI